MESEENMKAAFDRLSVIFAKAPKVEAIEWTFRGERVPPEKLFAQDGTLGIFVKMASLDAQYHGFTNSLDFTVEESPDSLCGVRVVPRPDVELPCYFSLYAALKETLWRTLGRSPKETIDLDGVLHLPDEEIVPLYKFDWP